MSSTTWRRVRLLGAFGLLGVLLWRLGSGPFLAGIESVDSTALLIAFGLTVLTTVAASWRWTVVARGLGVGVPLRLAIPAYYRSQFLNAALPGGVLGDVHRGVRYGRLADDVGGGLRAVAWERTSGQIVQGAITVVVLLASTSPLRSVMVTVTAAIVSVAALVTLVVRVLPDGGSTRLARAVRTIRADVRVGLLDRRSWPIVIVSSAIVAAGHTATFVVAARTAGVTTPLSTLVPIAMVVLLAAAIPLSVAGWGFREGAAAWAFAGVGLGAAAGIRSATAFGVMTLVATLPGGVIVATSALRTRRRRTATPTRPRNASTDPVPAPAVVAVQGANRG